MIVSSSLSAAPLKKNLARISQKDTVCRVWVIFTDKNSSPRTVALAPGARSRRLRNSITGIREADIAVPRDYITRVEGLGGRCRNVFTWANAASFVVRSSVIQKLAAQSFVKDMVLVREFWDSTVVTGPPRLQKSGASGLASQYGGSYPQMKMINVPLAVRYLRSGLGKPPGDGVIIGLFDTGFRLKHSCLRPLVNDGGVVADSDFVDKDGSVEDPDSVANNTDSPYYHNDSHGSQTLALIAGNDPGKFMGVACGAHFVLARTEDTKRLPDGSESERYVEEDNWAAAMVWAENMGANIVSSSLGYRTDFTPPDSDYMFADMDGKTTIISKAAAVAASNGVVVVNSMGNEGPGSGSLNAPADVEDVVSVGGVNSDLTIASFSGRGPTADNRVKPDLCAQGSQVDIPDIYPASGSQGAYTTGMGTSYATPLVAGIAALIVQSHASDSGNAIRQRLYSSCFFVPGQNVADNNYGRGIPDALLACLSYEQTYITISDSFLQPVAGAVITAGSGVTVGTSDSLGYAIIALSGQFPETLAVHHPFYLPAKTVVPSRHSKVNVVMAPKFILSVYLKDTLGNPVKGTVFWKVGGAAAFDSLKTDSAGLGRLTPVVPTIEVYGEAGGYYGSGHVVVDLGAGTTSMTLVLKPRPVSQFILYPNVLNIAGKKQHLHIEFIASPDKPQSYSQLFKAAIRSIDGTLVWSHSQYLEEKKPVVLTWPQKGETIVAPGVYYLIISYAGKLYKEKFFVVG
jgi:hypothetical protein